MSNPIKDLEIARQAMDYILKAEFGLYLGQHVTTKCGHSGKLELLIFSKLRLTIKVVSHSTHDPYFVNITDVYPDKLSDTCAKKHREAQEA